MLAALVIAELAVAESTTGGTASLSAPVKTPAHESMPAVARPAIPVSAARHPSPYEPHLVEVARQTYENDTDKAHAIVAALESSGPADAAYVGSARTFSDALAPDSRVEKWECFRAGCYFRMATRDADVNLTDTVLKARDHAAALNTLTMVLDDGAEHKVIVVFGKVPV